MTDIESSIEDHGPITRRLAVHVPGDRFQQAVEKAYAKLSSRVKLPGFRPGKAPRKVLEMHYADSVREDVTKDLIETSCAEVLRSRNLDVVSAPILLEQTLDENGDLHYKAEIEIRPEVALKDYKGRELVRRIQRIGEDDIDGAIERLRERLAQLVTEEERVNVAHGDVVLFDMQASADGRPIASVSGEGYSLEVGTGRFPADFERQLVGVTRGIPTPIEVDFPAEYAEAELAGKHVRFQVTVREIKNKVLPALGDDFVRELDLQGVDDMEQLRVKVREDLERHAVREAERRARNRMIEAFVDEHEFDVPRSHVHSQVHSMMHEMGIEDAHSEGAEEIHKAVEPAAVKQVKARFLLDAVAKAEALEVGQDELTNEVRRQIAAAGSAADRVRQYFADRSAVVQLHGNMLRDKAMQRIIELSAQRDEQVEKAELAER